MQPYYVVILLFSICLLHGLFRAFYDAGKADVSMGNQVFLIPEGFGRYTVIPSPFNTDLDFIGKLKQTIDGKQSSIQMNKFCLGVENWRSLLANEATS